MNRWNNIELLAEARLVLGDESKWNGNNYSELADTRLANEWDIGNSQSQKAMIALLISARVIAFPLASDTPGKSAYSKALQGCLASLLDSIRVQGRTAYVGYGSGGKHAVGMRTQALAMTAMALSKHSASSKIRAYFTNPLLEKVVNYVAGGGNGRRSGYGYFGGGSGLGGFIGAVVSIGLSRYDHTKGNTNADLALLVAQGPHNLMMQQFPLDQVTSSSVKLAGKAKVSDATASVKFAWSELLKKTDGPLPVVFAAKGTGEVSIAATMDFVPKQLFPDPVYRGIYVTKTVRLLDGNSEAIAGAKGLVDGSVETGTRVIVSISLTSPDDLRMVKVVDPLPGGLEPLDPNVYDDASTKDDSGNGGGLWNWRRWWCGWFFQYFNERETRKDEVRWTSNSLPAGTYTLEYKAIATTTGCFAFPPTKAEVLEQPEVMGLSAASMLAVTPTAKDKNFLASGASDSTTSKALSSAADSCSILTGID